MELLLISENKIKISLTKEDLDGYSITSEDIDYDNTETRRVFWTLLDEAKRVTGFDAAKSRIFIQIYPGKDGGCELYVSKINKSTEDVGSVGALKRLVKQCESVKSTEMTVCRLQSIEGLIAVCKRLKALGYNGEASAFSEGKERFYLTLDGYDTDSGFLEEYGGADLDGRMIPYIKEHCTLICDKDAVQRLSEL